MRDSNYFSIIPAEVRHSKVSDKAKLLYGDLVGLSTRKGYAFASNKYLAESTDVHPITISKQLRELSEFGFIQLDITQEDGNDRKIFLLAGVGYKRNDLEGISEMTNTPKRNDLEGISEMTNTPNPANADNVRVSGIKKEPINKVIKKDINKAYKTNGQIFDYDRQFELLWDVFPIKRGKKEAKKSFIKSLKNGTDFKDIQNGLNKYLYRIKVEEIDTQYISRGDTWFSNELWNDDNEPSMMAKFRYSMKQFSSAGIKLNIPDPKRPIGK